MPSDGVALERLGGRGRWRGYKVRSGFSYRTERAAEVGGAGGEQTGGVIYGGGARGRGSQERETRAAWRRRQQAMLAVLLQALDTG